MSDDEGYTGPAVLTIDGRDVPVQARLDARHEPQDGRLHWFGRLRPVEEGVDLPDGTDLVLRTAGGHAPARLGDRDPWGRYRVTGVGRPPYALDDPDLDAD